MIPRIRRAGTVIAQVIVWPVLILGVGWGALALWLDGPAARWLAGSLAGAFVLGCLLLLIVVRPLWRGQLAVAVVLLLVIGWWRRFRRLLFAEMAAGGPEFRHHCSEGEESRARS